MSHQTLAGTTVAIATGKPATVNSTGFAALTWEVLGEVTQAPSLGDEYTDVTTLLLAESRTKHLKGSADGGMWTVSLNTDGADDGQALATTAEAARADYSFRVTYPNGEKDYCFGVVMSFKRQGGGADDLDTRQLSVAVNSAVVNVPAA